MSTNSLVCGAEQAASSKVWLGRWAAVTVPGPRTPVIRNRTLLPGITGASHLQYKNRSEGTHTGMKAPSWACSEPHQHQRALPRSQPRGHSSFSFPCEVSSCFAAPHAQTSHWYKTQILWVGRLRTVSSLLQQIHGTSPFIHKQAV